LTHQLTVRPCSTCDFSPSALLLQVNGRSLGAQHRSLLCLSFERWIRAPAFLPFYLCHASHQPVPFFFVSYSVDLSLVLWSWLSDLLVRRLTSCEKTVVPRTPAPHGLPFLSYPSPPFVELTRVVPRGEATRFFLCFLGVHLLHRCRGG